MLSCPRAERTCAHVPPPARWRLGCCFDPRRGASLRSCPVPPCHSSRLYRLYRRFHTDPSGTYVKYEAKAIGSGSEGAQTALQESYR